MATKTEDEYNNLPLFNSRSVWEPMILSIRVISSRDVSDCNVSFNCTVILWVIYE